VAFAHRARGEHSGQRNMTLLKQKIGDIVGAVTVPSQTITASDTATVDMMARNKLVFRMIPSPPSRSFPKHIGRHSRVCTGRNTSVLKRLEFGPQKAVRGQGR
jgi:hypothetical protein